MPFLKKTDSKKKKLTLFTHGVIFYVENPKKPRDNQNHKIAEHMCWTENQFDKGAVVM